MRSILILVMGALALAVSACSASADRSRLGVNFSPVGSWTLWQIRGESVETAVPKTAKVPTLTIDHEGQVSGTAGVNQYGSSVPAGVLAQNRFEVGPVIATRMAGPPQAMQLESCFLGLLQEARRYECDGRTLTLLNESGVLLRFETAGRD